MQPLCAEVMVGYDCVDGSVCEATTRPGDELLCRHRTSHSRLLSLRSHGLRKVHQV